MATKIIHNTGHYIHIHAFYVFIVPSYATSTLLLIRLAEFY